MFSKDCRINLQGSWMNGADLREARLESAVLVTSGSYAKGRTS